MEQSKKILITGSDGFLGRNLVEELKNRKFNNIMVYDRHTKKSALHQYCKEADFIYHLAGVNRPQNQDEYMTGNHGLTETLISYLKEHDNKCPIMLASSTQAEKNNPYGISKKAAEDLVFSYGIDFGVEVFVYQFPNVFGKWSKPNYNSAVTTFCYNISRCIDITINDRNTLLTLVYIDDLVNELINALNGKENRKGSYCYIEKQYKAKLGEIVDAIYSFKRSKENGYIPNLSDSFMNKLYSTYLSYLPEKELNSQLSMNVDERGSFTEFIKTMGFGQVSINISKPGITKGNHWHHTKNEKFLVVGGKGVVRLRKISVDTVVEYFVDAKELQVIDIPPGYTHNIENLGETDMVTVMWVNEVYDSNNPDTYYEEV